MLRRVGVRAGEAALQHFQLSHVLEVEPLPSVRGAARAVARNLIREQALDAVQDARSRAARRCGGVRA